MADNPPSQSYDWRLAYLNLEVRDHYFSRLKSHIELAHKMSGKKVDMPTKARPPKKLLTLEQVALVTHSMGSQVAHYFFKWVEADGYGNGGPSWVDEHIGWHPSLKTPTPC